MRLVQVALHVEVPARYIRVRVCAPKQLLNIMSRSSPRYLGGTSQLSLRYCTVSRQQLAENRDVADLSLANTAPSAAYLRRHLTSVGAGAASTRPLTPPAAVHIPILVLRLQAMQVSFQVLLAASCMPHACSHRWPIDPDIQAPRWLRQADGGDPLEQPSAGCHWRSLHHLLIVFRLQKQ